MTTVSTLWPVTNNSQVCTLCCFSSLWPPQPVKNHSVVPLSQIWTRRDIRSFAAFLIKATANLVELSLARRLSELLALPLNGQRDQEESPSAPHYCCELCFLFELHLKNIHCFSSKCHCYHYYYYSDLSWIHSQCCLVLFGMLLAARKSRMEDLSNTLTCEKLKYGRESAETAHHGLQVAPQAALAWCLSVCVSVCKSMNKRGITKCWQTYSTAESKNQLIKSESSLMTWKHWLRLANQTEPNIWRQLGMSMSELKPSLGQQQSWTLGFRNRVKSCFKMSIHPLLSIKYLEILHI